MKRSSLFAAAIIAALSGATSNAFALPTRIVGPVETCPVVATAVPWVNATSVLFTQIRNAPVDKEIADEAAGALPDGISTQSLRPTASCRRRFTGCPQSEGSAGHEILVVTSMTGGSESAYPRRNYPHREATIQDGHLLESAAPRSSQAR
jgi:hypothetical protein